MKVEVLKEADNEMELSFDNLTIASLLSKYLNEDPRVEFAAFREEHPLKEDVRLFFRVKEGNPREVLKEVVTRAIADVKELRDALLSSLS